MERRLRGFQIAEQPVHLTELVQRQAEVLRAAATLQVHARARPRSNCSWEALITLH